jgi:hypothetical protein
MKKVVVLLFLSPFFASAQNVIDGIGKLKLGSSPAVLSEIGYTSDPIEVKERDVYFDKVYKKSKGTDVYLILPNEKLESKITGSSFHPNVKMYCIPSYQPVEGVVIESLTLKYWNDSLYYINCNNPSKLIEAFELKYGKAKLDLKEKEREYVNGYGNTITKIDKTYTQTFDTGNPKIECESILSIWHDSKGKESFIHFLTLNYVDIYELVNEYDKNKEQEIKDNKEKEKRKGLEGL